MIELLRVSKTLFGKWETLYTIENPLKMRTKMIFFFFAIRTYEHNLNSKNNNLSIYACLRLIELILPQSVSSFSEFIFRTKKENRA